MGLLILVILIIVLEKVSLDHSYKDIKDYIKENNY